MQIIVISWCGVHIEAFWCNVTPLRRNVKIYVFFANIRSVCNYDNFVMKVSKYSQASVGVGIPSTCDLFYTYLILIKDTRCAQWQSRQIMKCSNGVKIVYMISWWKYYVMNHAGTSIQFLYTQIHNIQNTIARQKINDPFSNFTFVAVISRERNLIRTFLNAFYCHITRVCFCGESRTYVVGDIFFSTVSPIPLI